MLRITSSVGIISLLLATPCFSSFTGFYVGAGAGPEGATFSQRAHVVQPTLFGTGGFQVSATNHFSGTGAFGTLFGGYGLRYDRYYVAGEINGNLSSVEYDLTNNEYVHQNFAKTHFTVRNSEGVSLLPGFYLSPTTLVYGRVGYANGRLKIVEGADPSIHNITKNLSGIRYGGGIRHALTPQWSVMMDYSQINYDFVTSHYFDPFGVVLKNTKITPTTAQVAFGAIYSFDQPEPVFVK